MCPHKLWDHCLELEALIGLHTSLDSYKLQGQVPKTILSGHLALIKYEWFNWVKWYDVNAGFPDAKEKLGKWLGPSIDIGPAMTAKILKSNGQVLYLSSHRGLINFEYQDPDKQGLMKKFMDNLCNVIGSPASPNDLDKLDPAAVTPENELYEENNGNVAKHVPNIDSITPEMQDRYIRAEVNLPYQGISHSGKVQHGAKNTDGELDGIANPNPILGTRTNQVKFDDGKLAVNSANIIAENMYPQCYIHAINIDGWRTCRMTYNSVVSQDSDRIALTIAALNNLELKASDVMNAYLTLLCEEQVWTILCPEFGGNAGEKAILVRALYGLKSPGALFSWHLVDCMRMLDYTPCTADPDVWMKAMIRPEDGFIYYAYILFYADNVLYIHHDAETAIGQLNK